MELALSSDGEYLEWLSPSGQQYSWNVEEPVETTEEFLEFLTAVVAWMRETDGEKKMRVFDRSGVTGGSVDSGYELLALKDRVKALERAAQELREGQQAIRLDHADLYTRLQEQSALARNTAIKRINELESRLDKLREV